jgi:NADPH:quinone reductase-like Zn-dependent oxidoreductase
VGLAVIQIARHLGARVIATASPANHDFLRARGADPVTYGDGLVERVRAIATPSAVVDAAGGGEQRRRDARTRVRSLPHSLGRTGLLYSRRGHSPGPASPR